VTGCIGFIATRGKLAFYAQTSRGPTSFPVDDERGLETTLAAPGETRRFATILLFLPAFPARCSMAPWNYSGFLQMTGPYAQISRQGQFEPNFCLAFFPAGLWRTAAPRVKSDPAGFHPQ